MSGEGRDLVPYFAEQPVKKAKSKGKTKSKNKNKKAKNKSKARVNGKQGKKQAYADPEFLACVPDPATIPLPSFLVEMAADSPQRQYLPVLFADSYN